MFAEGRSRPAESCSTYAAQLEEIIPVLSSRRQVLPASAPPRAQELELVGCSQGLLPARKAVCLSLLPPATEEEQAVASSQEDPKLTEPLTLSYFQQQHYTKLQYSKPSSPLGPPMYPLPSDQKVHLHCSSLGLF